jgi:hypothetical protein
MDERRPTGLVAVSIWDLTETPNRLAALGLSVVGYGTRTSAYAVQVRRGKEWCRYTVPAGGGRRVLRKRIGAN